MPEPVFRIRQTARPNMLLGGAAVADGAPAEEAAAPPDAAEPAAAEEEAPAGEGAPAEVCSFIILYNVVYTSFYSAQLPLRGNSFSEIRLYFKSVYSTQLPLRGHSFSEIRLISEIRT